MELQKEIHLLREAGAELYAVSYDEPDALADFAAEFGITYPLLSDPDSEVIRDYGILNTLVPEDDHPWYGMPFPGVYVTDSAGTITAKFFESHLALRPTVQQLARAVSGHDVASELGPLDAPPDEVELAVTMSTEPLAPGVWRDVTATFRLPAGQHIYGEPVPAGMVATGFELDEGVIGLQPSTPDTSLHVLDGTGQELQVYEGGSNGVVRIHQPVAMSGGMATRDAGDRIVTISGAVRFQACDAQVCGIPQRVPFSFEVPLGRVVMPHPAEEGDGTMDFRKHFAAMSERRTT